jgi:hypothetical protein
VCRKVPTSLAIALILALVSAFAAWVYFVDTFVRQARRMRTGRDYLPVITNAVYSQPQFRGAQVGVGTAAGGCFLVAGMVDTERQLSELERTIVGTRPPLAVLYRVKVLERYSETKNGTEPGGAAPNRSQPGSPESNRTPAAAGSGR